MLIILLGGFIPYSSCVEFRVINKRNSVGSMSSIYLTQYQEPDINNGLKFNHVKPYCDLLIGGLLQLINTCYIYRPNTVYSIYGRWRSNKTP